MTSPALSAIKDSDWERTIKCIVYLRVFGRVNFDCITLI